MTFYVLLSHHVNSLTSQMRELGECCQSLTGSNEADELYESGTPVGILSWINCLNLREA